MDGSYNRGLRLEDPVSSSLSPRQSRRTLLTLTLLDVEKHKQEQ